MNPKRLLSRLLLGLMAFTILTAAAPPGTICGVCRLSRRLLFPAGPEDPNVAVHDRIPPPSGFVW